MNVPLIVMTAGFVSVISRKGRIKNMSTCEVLYKKKIPVIVADRSKVVLPYFPK